MTWKTFLPVTAGVVMLSLVGCASPLYSLMRGQSPDPSYNSAQQAGYNSGAILYGGGSQEIQGCPMDGGYGGYGGCPGGPANGAMSHHHEHVWSYTQPQGLMYPPQGQPTGVVFYPYYTVKGPDDFFLGMKSN